MNKAKKRANEIRRKYKKYEFNCNDLKLIAKDHGYSVIEFNNLDNNCDISELIDALDIGKIAAHSRGFTYANENYRLIFIHEDLTEKEKRSVLSHELGHIACGHLSHATIIGNDVDEEKEANEFAFYIVHPNVIHKATAMARRHKAICIIFLCCILTAAAMVTNISVHSYNEKFYGNYYITTTGNKYHNKNCRYIIEKTNVTRLTKEQYKSGEYAPCKICLPDEQ